ncbi:MAG: CoA ester lyase, partial [Pseudomonadota bacterium]
AIAAAAKSVADAAGKAAIWAMMETPLGILNALEIGQAPGMGGFVLGTNDLAKDLACRTRADRLPMMTALQTCLLAARAAGIPCVDGVYNAFRDTDGLRSECEQGRDLGMDGKTLIHPAQVEVANDVFAPTEAEADLARRQIDAFDAAMAEGKGLAVLDGKIVENLHVDSARKTLAKLEAIAALGV